MSVFAIVPWDRIQYKDNIFNINPPYNRDYLIEPYVEMKEKFEKEGHTIHTIDMYESYDDVDYFLFFSVDWDIYHAIVGCGKGNRMVYCTAEPPSVCKYNSRAGYRILKHIFPYILTWNDNWVDGKSIFKRNTPYWFVDQRDDSVSFSDKKLITCISGNKHSNYTGELYSERERAIRYFEEHHPEEFDLYGSGWSNEQHRCYRGTVTNKALTYHKYKFAICYENIEGLNGYVTEKILDCLVSGIVPIYAGSTDIEKYVPENCFIKLRDYASYSELYDYISCIDEDKYKSFLYAADMFLNSPKADYFSGTRYAEYILEALLSEKPRFRSSSVAYRLLKLKYGNI